MKIIDRYILKELFEPFLFGLLSFTMILSASMVLFELVRAVVIQGMPLQIALQIFIFKMPSVVVYILPMSSLLGALLAFGRLSKDSEIIAFKGSGISLFRLMVPVFVFGVAVSMLTLSFYEVVVPESNKMVKNLMVKTAVSQSPKIEENVFLPEVDGGKLKRMFYAQKTSGSTMKGVIVAEFSEGRLAQLISAKKALFDKKKKEWIFEDGVVHLISETGEYKHLIKFQRQNIAIKFTPEDFSIGNKNVDDMSINELKSVIKSRDRMGIKSTDISIQLNMRTAIPFACLVFAILGAPLGLSPKRATSSTGLGFSIIIIFVYYILMFTSIALGELEILSPWFSAWLPNFITFGIGCFTINKASQI